MHYQQGEESTQFTCFQGEFLHHGKKIWKKHWFRGSLHSCIWALFRLNFSCALLPMVSSPFASPWGVDNFGAFYLGCVSRCPFLRGSRFFSLYLKWFRYDFCLAFDHLYDFFSRFSSFSLFSELVTCVYCQCTRQGGDWGPVDGCSWLWWVIDNVVWTCWRENRTPPSRAAHVTSRSVVRRASQFGLLIDNGKY
jgi:hypothetical protein